MSVLAASLHAARQLFLPQGSPVGDCAVALAQRCALKKIAADKAGVAVTDSNFINVDIQMRINLPHIFAIGDAVGWPMLGTRRCTKRTWRLK